MHRASSGSDCSGHAGSPMGFVQGSGDGKVSETKSGSQAVLVWITDSPNGTQIQAGEFSLLHQGDFHDTGMAEGIYNSYLSPSEQRCGARLKAKPPNFQNPNFYQLRERHHLQQADPDRSSRPLPSLRVGCLGRTLPAGSSRLSFAVVGAEGGL